MGLNASQAARTVAGRPDRCREGALAAAVERVLGQICRDQLELDPAAPDINEFSIFQTVESSAMQEVVRLAGRDVRANRAIGAMVGMAVADAVGGMFEFVPVGSKGCRFDPKRLRYFGGYNKFQLKPGQWTDDTSMALCLADSLLACSGYDGADVRIRFWNWWNRAYNNAFRHDESRSSSVGLGGNISLSLLTMKAKPPPSPRFEGLGEDAGNGSVMRLAPVPIYFHTNIDLAMRVSAESSYTTHPGPRAAEACAFLGYIIAQAITRPARCWQTAAQFLDSCATSYLTKPWVAAQPALAKLLRSAERPGSKERCWNWRDPMGPFILETIEARGKTYNGYPVTADYFGSYSMDGLALAMHSIYHTRTFMAALTRCVNFLGDADSTGAICGQIAGAFYGVGAIDVRLVDQLRRWDAGEIALRGALLYVLGTQLSDEAQEKARASSKGALPGFATDTTPPRSPALTPTPARAPAGPRPRLPPCSSPPLLPHGRRQSL
mmetsp:Transcript_114931/g.245383  ORF Transcript_114931/g.245383 Transcript_114931/m.245383 type:complete len:494 (-) Transcript_114931:21-1502(-)